MDVVNFEEKRAFFEETINCLKSDGLLLVVSYVLVYLLNDLLFLSLETFPTVLVPFGKRDLLLKNSIVMINNLLHLSEATSRGLPVAPFIA